MATCIAEITEDIHNGSNGDYPIIISTTPSSVNFSNTAKQKLTIITNTQDSAVCTLVINNISTTIAIAFFKLSDDRTSVVNVGNVYTSDNITHFQKDLSPGEYYLCFSTQSGTVSGTFTTAFSGYVTSASLPGKGYHGEFGVANLTTSRVERDCSEPMIFEFVDGELPPGCEFHSSGQIMGILPNLDCIDTTDQYSPSINWFFDSEGRWRPIPRRWVFRVKVSLENFPGVSHIEQFSIDVHNDWSRDRDAFMDGSEKGFDRYLCAEEVQSIEPINKAQFECVKPTQEEKSYEPISSAGCHCMPLATKSNEFMNWYEVNKNSLYGDIKKFADKTAMVIMDRESASSTQAIINTNTTPTENVDDIFLSTGRTLNMKKFPISIFGYSGDVMTGILL